MDKRRKSIRTIRNIWCKPKLTDGHFKKVIKYGIFGLKNETDYYKNEKIKGTFAWSKYDFENGKFKYFLEKPNSKIISLTKKGNLKSEKPTIVTKIEKKEFEKYVVK